MRLTFEDVRASALKLRVHREALYAVVLVESAGRTGSMVKGKLEPLIRWEGHYCYRLAKKLGGDILNRFQRVRLASPKAQAIKNPASQSKRYAMLAKGKAIDRDVAISSCSWGVGQVMGSHWKWLRYKSHIAFERSMRSGVGGQVEVMARYIARAGLADELQALDWDGFARGYNGPNYRKFGYARKMENAYAKASGVRTVAKNHNSVYTLRQGASGEGVLEWQRDLVRYGYDVRPDGDYGPATKVATQSFQKKVGLSADGLAGPRTQAAMKKELEGLPGAVGKRLRTPRPNHTDTPVTPERTLWGLLFSLLKLIFGR